MKFFKSQAGDTIIEVMMAILVMSGVLGATFAVSNRSLKSTQANHERFQAQMYANQQAEWIKVFSANNKADITTNAATVLVLIFAYLTTHKNRGSHKHGRSYCKHNECFYDSEAFVVVFISPHVIKSIA